MLEIGEIRPSVWLKISCKRLCALIEGQQSIQHLQKPCDTALQLSRSWSESEVINLGDSQLCEILALWGG